ncbi:MAG TPA: succinate dehydrogenase/fumarate reductase iron-sulfur subunit [Mucilaginibacter sp.]|nr:succinate dehydrogenase/fumarate reductase iron-sulfur subunit [Mucilaginibacter sp.]
MAIKMTNENMSLTLRVWRQRNAQSTGKFVTYKAENISPDMSFLEMLDVVNEGLVHKNEDPIYFDHDCREGICGMCSLYINGHPHGPKKAITTCQLHMRTFHNGETITIEPWRAAPFPVIKDLAVDRSAFDRIQQAGGYVSVSTGGVPDANEIPIPKVLADEAFNSATCIGCGACVAACKNASAMLFVSAKVSQLAMLPQGQPERYRRVQSMVAQMDKEGFGNCTWTGACEAECPKEISITNISRMYKDYFDAKFFKQEELHEHPLEE